MTYDLTETGSLGPDPNVEGKQGIVRELDADLMLTPLAARELRDWLSERLEEVSEFQQKSASAEQAGDSTDVD